MGSPATLRPLCLFALCLLAAEGIVSQDLKVPPPKPLVIVQALRPTGLRVAVADKPGTEIVLFNGNVNVPIEVATERGQLSGSMVEAKDGFWTLRIPEAYVRVGDVIFYWIHVRRNGHGHTYPPDIAKITSRVEDNCLPTITTVNGKSACKGQLIFEDNFDELDSNKWKHIVQFPNSSYTFFSIYTASKENSYTENGVLHIRPSEVADDVVNGSLTLEGCTAQPGTSNCQMKAFAFYILPPTYSAWLQYKDTFRFGRLEVRAKLAVGDWLYNLIWLVPPDETDRETGRVNLVWALGNENLVVDNGDSIGADRLFPSILIGHCHRKLTLGENKTLPGNTLWADDFHTYTVIWSPDGFMMEVDGSLLVSAMAPEAGFTSNEIFNGCDKLKGEKIAPFDKELLINMALHVGGFNQFRHGSVSKGHPKPWTDNSPKASLQFWKDKEHWLPTWTTNKTVLKIDWVKLWAL